MSNFAFLGKRPEYALFANACIEAERTFTTSAAMCAIGSRKGLELAVKWVYDADEEIKMPYKDNLSSLIHEPSFRFAMDKATWNGCKYVVKLGNHAVHTDQRITPQEGMYALKCLFAFVQWIDYCYGKDYEERTFNEREVPAVKLALDIKAIKEREALIEERDSRIQELEEQIRSMSASYTQTRKEDKSDRTFNPDDIPEYETRRRFIDVDLKYVGWDLDRNVETEVEVAGMAGNPDQLGYVDYVLNGKNGKPLALIEAKRTMYDPNKGLQQARLYSECLEAKYGYKPMIFLTNGFETYFLDDETAPKRQVSGVFSQDDLQRLMNRRDEVLPLGSMSVNMDISGRYYQIEAIRAVCENIEEGHRKHLLVMATGTGKTRTAAGLLDLLAKAGHVTNALFLADRVALVSQAKSSFQNYLPNMTLCNLCSSKEKSAAADARVVFSTYPSILNSIDEARGADGERLFGPAHFDLIIVDEAHRSIFKKYRAIFEYFDAQLVGLTATPKDEVDRNTYDFFEVQRGVPTYVYEYQTAVEQDKVLVPYYNIEVSTEFLDKGITYDDLSEEDKDRYDEDFEEQANSKAPDFVPSSQVDKFVYNIETVDTVIQDLMEHGVKVNGGERLGKTIIFAANRQHAELIVQRFEKLYPALCKGGFVKRVIHTDDYSHTIIDEFKMKSLPVVTVSVDMMDTGIDVPEVTNLVFFKQVRSKAKFWQMIGRGTRLCPELWPVDSIDGEYEDKRRFFIFDYCGNFEFFRQGKKEAQGTEPKTLSELIFERKAEIVQRLQGAAFADDDYQDLRTTMVGDLVALASELDREHVPVKLRLRSVEKFSTTAAFEFLSEGDLGELQKDVAPLVHIDEEDQFALRFDAFMFGYMASMLGGYETSFYQSKLVKTALLLEGRATIPQVKEKLPVIKRVSEDGYLDTVSVLELERLRVELRGLIRFIADGKGVPIVITNLQDPIVGRKEGEVLSPGEDFTDYKLKVNRYISDHADTLAIHKLKTNKPLTETDYETLERILTKELGSQKDYERTFGETPFGLLVRSIAKLDHEAAMEAFAEFLNDQALSQAQIAFVHKVIEYVEVNGYMEPEALMKAPFDRPVSFFRLFDDGRQKRLVAIINSVRDNALLPVA